MRKDTHDFSESALTRRERQIMDVVYAGGEVTARHIWEQMPDAPSYSTVRTLLGVLEEKGYLSRRPSGKAFAYRAKRAREKVAASALRRLLATFFEGSIERAVCGLLELDDSKLTDDELRRLARLIKDARKEKK